MVLALKLITAGVSYQDGLKKPEVTPISSLLSAQYINWSAGRPFFITLKHLTEASD